ncbi:MAG TPA: hypothetical protein VFB49_13150 [Patescibacteria group bacterium]|nr:hypothetical protein [Patescibacteria group bacterium]
MRILPTSLLLACLAGLAAGAFPAIAATSPPALLNYQGVLRDAADKPRNGSFDMTFRFFDALSAGSEILVDAHAAPSGVAVTNGLFNVLLGGGTITDGSGAGTYLSLDGVFRDYDTVYLEVQIGGETLSPRTRIVAAPYSLNAGSLGGLPASNYVDTTSSDQIKTGSLICDAGLFGLNDTGANYGYGVWGRGTQGGGVFLDTNGTGAAYPAIGNTGIEAFGTTMGGNFHTVDNTGTAFLGFSGGYGVLGYGSAAGGVFSTYSGSPTATLGSASYGVDAAGASASGATAGQFKDTSTGSVARLGYGAYGVHSTASTAGYFLNSGGHSVVGLASGNWGVQGTGNFCGVGCGGGGLFSDPTGGTTSYVAYSNVGIETHASGSGGSFYNTNGISTAVATSGSFGVVSNGTKSFAQNHPDDPGSIIAYTALEGDEAGTYTRGTARLLGGEARIALGETFQWVTNPDIGLTAHLTPVGDWADLYIASKSTREIVVKSRDPRASNAAFDYVVFGLRVGFEDIPVVREKEHDMPIPAGASADDLFSRKPGLRRFTALSRFRAARPGAPDGDAPLDLSATEALKAKIHVFDPGRDGDAFRAPAAPPMPAAPLMIAGTAGVAAGGTAAPVPSTAGAGRAGEEPAAAAFPPNTFPLEVAGTVRAGDVVTVTGAPGGQAVIASQPLDRGVIGIVGGPADRAFSGQAPIVVSGVVALCNVDATAGAIEVGDLLVASATPGHAARPKGAPPAGTVIAKALEPLEGGTGAIRVLVLGR